MMWGVVQDGAAFLKACPAKHWSVANRLERYNSTMATLSASDDCLSTASRLSHCAGRSAPKTAFGKMRELLFMKEALLIGTEDKLSSALNTN
jgi:hypothetical protein